MIIKTKKKQNPSQKSDESWFRQLEKTITHRGDASSHRFAALLHRGDVLLHQITALSHRGDASSHQFTALTHRRGALTLCRGALLLPQGEFTEIIR